MGLKYSCPNVSKLKQKGRLCRTSGCEGALVLLNSVTSFISWIKDCVIESYKAKLSHFLALGAPDGATTGNGMSLNKAGESSCMTTVRISARRLYAVHGDSATSAFQSESWLKALKSILGSKQPEL